MMPTRLRRASLVCLAVWLVIWVLWMVMRFLPVDGRGIPGIGPFLLASLVGIFVAPLLSAGLAVICLIRRDRRPADWVVLAVSLAIIPGEMMVFQATAWL